MPSDIYAALLIRELNSIGRVTMRSMVLCPAFRLLATQILTGQDLTMKLGNQLLVSYFPYLEALYHGNPPSKPAPLYLPMKLNMLLLRKLLGKLLGFGIF
jgi:hypothetical protein